MADDSEQENKSLIPSSMKMNSMESTQESRFMHIFSSFWVILFLYFIFLFPDYSIHRTMDPIPIKNNNNTFLKYSFRTNNFNNRNFYYRINLCAKYDRTYNISTIVNQYKDDEIIFQRGFIKTNSNYSHRVDLLYCHTLYTNTTFESTSIDSTIMMNGNFKEINEIQIEIITLTTRFIHAIDVINLILIITTVIHAFYLIYQKLSYFKQNAASPYDSTRKQDILLYISLFICLIFQIYLPNKICYSLFNSFLQSFFEILFLTLLFIKLGFRSRFLILLPCIEVLLFIASTVTIIDLIPIYTSIISIALCIISKYYEINSNLFEMNVIISVFTVFRVLFHVIIPLLIEDSFLVPHLFLKSVLNWFYSFLLLQTV